MLWRIFARQKNKKIYLPYFICSSVIDNLNRLNISIEFYCITGKFKPIFGKKLTDSEFLYVINYYGQLSNDEIIELKKKYKNLIIDNAQAYFQLPVDKVDTIYTCRKFFGVADGAFLYTDTILDENLEIDESYRRMNFLLGRFERTASEFYGEYASNNKMFADEQIKQISKLTNNLLHGIDYKFIKNRRIKNYDYLYDKLKKTKQIVFKKN